MKPIAWALLAGLSMGWGVTLFVCLRGLHPTRASACLSSHRELIVTEKLCKDGFCPVPIVVTVCDKAALTMPKGVQ